MKNLLSAIALAVVTVTASAVDVADAAEKIPVDIMIERASFESHRLTGRQIDTVGILRAFTGKPRVWLIGNTPPGFRASLDLTQLSEAERAAIYDQCDPTPCIARVLVTLQPKADSQGYPVFTLDGWK